MTLPPRVLPEFDPPNVFATDATDPSPSERREVGRQASPAPAVTPRMVGSEDEIL